MTSDSQTESGGVVSSTAWLGDTDADKARVAKWFWKMDYCKKHGLAPAQNWMWDIAETKWQEAQSPNIKEEDKIIMKAIILKAPPK